MPLIRWLALFLLVLPLSATAAADRFAAMKAVNALQAPFRDGARRGVEIKAVGGAASENGILLDPKAAFHDGEIEVDVSADVEPGASDTIRAFAGLTFRQGDAGYEAFYLRMRNGRARDQLQRNHSAQYISPPDWPWERLRKETPGVYESYVDLVPGRWTHMRVAVCGAQARLYVDRVVQPTLIVRDLKRGPSAVGGVGLWVGPGTVARFANLQIRPGAPCVMKD